jgi:Fe-S cluster biogenesis protein NfuA/nitrite reductase/ring-hydroxylating ferredoxin subunit
MKGSDFRERLQRIEGLVRALESAGDPNARASAVELMQLVMEVHGAGIERMMEIAFENEAAGREIVDRFGQDELVASLLLLYGMHPLDVETRVTQALDSVRPYMRSHGGNVELLGVEDGVVRLRLQGSCNGCASSAATLELAIENAIYDAAPDIAGLEVEGVVAQSPPGLVQLRARSHDEAQPPPAAGGGWEEVSGITALESGSVRTVDVSGRPVLFCRVGETLYAYGDACPGCGKAMRGAFLEATSLVCPSCGLRYDAMRAGRGLDKPGLHLEPFPLLVEPGQAKIALPAAGSW